MESLSAFRWDVSPEIFSIGPVHIRWYGLLFALAFIIGYQLLSWIFKVEAKNQKKLDSFTIQMIIATVAGARLGHCLFYNPLYYLNNPLEFLAVWEGGLASHGAALGIMFAVWLFSIRNKEFSLYWLMDRLTIPVALAAAFVRFGNFFNSEIVGRPSDLPWAVIFVRNQQFVDLLPRHPTQLYEAFSYIIIFILLLIIYKKYKEKTSSGLLAGLFLTLLFSARFIIEYFKEFQSAFENNLPLDMGQLLSLPMIAIGVYLLVTIKSRNNQNRATL